MEQDQRVSLERAVRTLARPLVRLLLRSGVTVQALMEIIKQVYVDVAMQEFSLPGRVQSQSRTSIITGLTRKEVQRLVKREPHDAPEEQATQQHRAASVLAGWVRDTEFLDSKNNPRVLPIAGDSGSFTALVRRYSGDMPVRGMLDELLRVGAVVRVDKDSVKLVARSYVPAAGNSEKIFMLGTDVADLVATIDHNIQCDATTNSASPRFQRKVMYDNLPVEAVEQFKKLSSLRAQQLIEEFDHWLARHDRDINPEITGHGRQRAGIGIYYFEDAPAQEKNHEHIA